MIEASFESTPESAPAARRFVVDFVRAGELADLVYDAATCAAELAANAVLHARGTFRIAVGVQGDEVRIEVTDGNVARMPVMIPANGSATDITIDSATGRGLRIVAATASRWGVVASATEKTVWCELARSGPTGSAEPLIEDSRPSEAPGTTVRLRAMPVRAAIASGMQVDGLVREFQLGLFDGATTDEERARFFDLVDVSAPARLAGRAAALEAAGRGDVHFDVDVVVDHESAAAIVAFRELLELLPSRVAMTSAVPSAEVSRFRAWIEREVGLQLRGAAPTAYTD